MTPPPHRVLILDLSVDPAIYRPTQHWRDLLGEVGSDSVALLRNETVPPLEGYTHLIVSGSEASITEPQPWFAPAEEAIRAAVDAGLPVLGSCFGHQLVVRALLGPSHVRRASRPELGWFPVEMGRTDDDGLGENGPLWMFCCHFDEVCDLPIEVRVLATTPDCGVHAYRMGEAPVWGVQAHPEILPEEGAQLLADFARKQPEVAELVEQALAGPRRDDGFGARLVRRFLETP